MPAAANRQANGSRYISFTAQNHEPWRRRHRHVCAGNVRQEEPGAANVSPLLNITSRFRLSLPSSFEPLSSPAVEAEAFALGPS